MVDGSTTVSDNYMVTLSGSDGGEFVLPFKAAIQSILLKDTLLVDEDEEEPHTPPTETIALERVKSETLTKVVEFLKHHENDPMPEIPHPLPHDTFEQNVGNDWYQNFFDVENMPAPLLFDLMRAGNYMNIKSLLDLACLKVTFMLNGKNEEEIREILNLPAMTREEEERARIQHPWIFEFEGTNN
ncbi:hypothetical protein MPSEU_000275600 [Mayamaea pseudoterrestris]|nr:hypothetical protein MPSEU_000275600 [Mayamaea pseudoterrestris]